MSNCRSMGLVSCVCAVFNDVYILMLQLKARICYDDTVECVSCPEPCVLWCRYIDQCSSNSISGSSNSSSSSSSNSSSISCSTRLHS